jgi:hypothetical protein
MWPKGMKALENQKGDEIGSRNMRIMIISREVGMEKISLPPREKCESKVLGGGTSQIKSNQKCDNNCNFSGYH